MQLIDYILEQIAKGDEDIQRLESITLKAECVLAKH